MLNLSQYALIAGLMMVALAVGCYVLALTLGRSVRQAPVMAHAGVNAQGGRDGAGHPAAGGRQGWLSGAVGD